MTPWGTFFLVSMPFGLKNVGATYQRDMVSMFHDMIHNSVDIYANDILTKYREKDDYISYLEKIF